MTQTCDFQACQLLSLLTKVEPDSMIWECGTNSSFSVDHVSELEINIFTN